MALILVLAALAGASVPPPSMAGVWDLHWKSRRGANRSGWLSIRQQGAQISAELHASEVVTASGRIEGNRFALTGSRLLIPYRIEGRIDGGRIVGDLKALRIQRHFIGERRGG